MLNAAWDGTPGPNTPRTLETVHYIYGIPPDAEFPFTFEEFWLYARLFRTNQAEGEREFSVRGVWLDAPNRPRTVIRRLLGQVRFTNAHPVQNIAWVLRPLKVPGLGQYEFRLRCRSRTSGQDVERIVAREFIRIERTP
ncbi:MAG TPA: hypothetical protein VKE74_05380 [Gemmataceae bacterium]|nr:hypothetical protein [Gemmataceae bacterium]